MQDNWKHRSEGMKCATCMWYAPKQRHLSDSSDRKGIGRCRRYGPSMNGWPVVYEDDWCGEHKLDEEKV